MAASRKPAGLGKRKVPFSGPEDEHAAGEGGEPEVFFPVEDDKNEIEHVLAMFESAEEVLDDTAKSIPLLRAVVHECDRLGRLKDIIDKDNTIADLDEEQLESLRSLTLNADFYRIFGDALYHLAFLEAAEAGDNDEEVPINSDLLEAAIERYRNGMELFDENVPLNMSLQRALMIRLASGDKLDAKVESIPKLIKSSHDSAEACSFFLSALERLSPWDSSGSMDLLERIRKILSDLPKNNQINMMLLSITLIRINNFFSRELYNQTSTTLLEAAYLIRTLEGAKLEGAAQLQFLKLLAEFYLWKGCVEEVISEEKESEGEDSGLEKRNESSAADESKDGDLEGSGEQEVCTIGADAYYNLAVQTWREISEKFSIEIPNHILDLETK